MFSVVPYDFGSLLLTNTYIVLSIHFFFFVVYRTTTGHPQWMLFEFDFDECFAFDPETRQPSETSAEIIDFYLERSSQEDLNPLVAGILTNPAYNTTYLSLYRDFLVSIFGSNSSTQPSSVYSAYFNMLAPWIERDYLWQSAVGLTYEQFVLDAQV